MLQQARQPRLVRLKSHAVRRKQKPQSVPMIHFKLLPMSGLSVPTKTSSNNSSASFLGRQWLRTAGVLAGMFGLALFLQWLGGVYTSELDGNGDEAAHFVTGLMVRDYLLSGFHIPPLRYAEVYYLHYPKVALGHWPPGFYILQAAWTLIFPPSGHSVLVLMALITGTVGVVIYRLSRKRFGEWAAILLGAGFVALRVVQEDTGAVMAESLLTLTGLLAAAAFGRFLESDSWKDSVAFGAWMLATIFVKGDGWGLALLPPIALALSKRWRLLLGWKIWAGAAVVLLIMPWQLFTLRAASEGWDNGGLPFIKEAAPAFIYLFAHSTGIVVAMLAVLGICVTCIIPWFRNSPVSGFWASMTALVAATWLFHLLVPAGIYERRLILAMPAFLLLAGAGGQWLAQQSKNPRLVGIAVAAVATITFLTLAFQIPPKTSDHFGEAAETALKLFPDHDDILFVAANSEPEGAFIAAVATREERPGHFVLRSSKVLSEGSWSGADEHLRYQDPEQVEQVLEGFGVRAIALDLNSKAEDNRLLRETITRHPDIWLPVELPAACARSVRLYRRQGGGRRNRRIELDLSHTLGHSVIE
jgi:hypothetical protein